MIAAAIFEHAFMRNAFFAGGAIAIATGMVGYFVVIREEVFAGDALSHVAFTGSLAALAYGFNQRLGLFAGTVVIALLLGALSSRRFASDVTIGTTFSWLLGLGSLFLYLFTTHHSTMNGDAGPNVLFGSIFGISHSQVTTAEAVSLAVVIAMAFIARPLLFASIDGTIAGARGVPVNAITTAFLLLLALDVAESVQLVGALLLLGLLASPAAAAARLTKNPYSGMLISSGMCLACVWAGLLISYAAPSLPPSFVIIALAFTCYATAVLVSRRLTNI